MNRSDCVPPHPPQKCFSKLIDAFSVSCILDACIAVWRVDDCMHWRELLPGPPFSRGGHGRCTTKTKCCADAAIATFRLPFEFVAQSAPNVILLCMPTLDVCISLVWTRPCLEFVLARGRVLASVWKNMHCESLTSRFPPCSECRHRGFLSSFAFLPTTVPSLRHSFQYMRLPHKPLQEKCS